MTTCISRRMIGALAVMYVVACAPPAGGAENPLPRVLQPRQEEQPVARFEQLQPGADNPSHFVARTKHVLEFARKNPAPAQARYLAVGGIEFPGARAISGQVIAALDAESARFDARLRDQSLSCRMPGDVPRSAKVIHFEAESGGLVVPVFLKRDADPLDYFEVSIDEPDAPILLVVTGYHGVAVRVTPSPRTQLAAVHVNSYHPSVILGVEASRVTQQYYSGADDGCAHVSSERSAGPLVIKKLGFEPTRATRYSTRASQGYEFAIGRPQPLRRGGPRLGNFIDPEMPAPHSYGIAMLSLLGYIRAAPESETGGELLQGATWYVLKPFRLPDGLAGGHSVVLVVRGNAVPSGQLQHSTMLRPIQRGSKK